MQSLCFSLLFLITDTVWGRDPPGTTYGFEDDVRTLSPPLHQHLTEFTGETLVFPLYHPGDPVFKILLEFCASIATFPASRTRM